MTITLLTVIVHAAVPATAQAQEEWVYKNPHSHGQGLCNMQCAGRQNLRHRRYGGNFTRAEGAPL